MTSDAALDPGGLMKRSLLELRKLRARLDEVESAGKEPIAIVGLGCRLPGGASDPEAYWKLLMDGRDAIVEMPPERWDVAAYYSPDPTAPGKSYVCHGGFLEHIADFDSQFFGVSRREAMSLDPQQRMLLEVAWEALEYGAQAPDRLYGNNAGVFIGIGSFEYAAHLVRSADVNSIDPYFGTGTALSAAAGRLSFTLGLTGPSMAIDTACSSSLVALHLACQSLRYRECDLALAGGVSLMVAPEVNIAFSKARLLATDSRCKTFDAAGDGYVRGEGCGVVVLKRLADAVRNGDRVIAQIRGSAVNQDGPSGGLVVPNGVSQEAVIRKALENAGVSPGDVDYIEAHGTGTSLGDPIEVGALGRVFGPGRPSTQSLVVGSVKTNIGHTESTAGIAGLIKVALSLDRETIPAHLHFRQPNPRIPWDLAPFVIPRQTTPWPGGGKRRVAGVSSFGFTGTNAHVIVEEAPSVDRALSIPDRSAHVLTLSAKSGDALRALASRLASHLAAHPELVLGDVCFSLNTGRARFREQVAMAASSLAELREKLESCADGRERDDVHRSESTKGPRKKTAFVFTAANGSYPDIGRELYESSPTFREAFDRCGGAPPELALEVALARLWESWGVRPAAVAGHGIGARVAAEHWPALAAKSDPRSCDRFIEIGPASDPASDETTWFAGLREGQSEWRQLAEAVARLAVQEPPIDWVAFDRDHPRRRVPLPTYPFQRERFWIDGKPRAAEEPPPSDVFYRADWEAKPAPAASSDPSGAWLILADRGGIGSALAAELEARGAECHLRFAGEPLDPIPTPLRGAIHLWPLDESPDLESAAAIGCGAALQLAQNLGCIESSAPLLLLVTRGAQAVVGDRDLTAVAHAPLWGLGKVIGIELPWLRCTLVDLDPDPDPDAHPDVSDQAARALLAEIGGDGEQHVAFRNGTRHVQRLVRAAAPPPETADLKPDRTYLVTGGLGAVGLRVARWMADNGARHIALLGRGEPSEDASEVIVEMRLIGTEITLLRADAASEQELAAALDTIAATMPPLAGVIHCAGVFHDRMLLQHEWPLFEKTFAPKVRGAWNLHTLTAPMDLDFFVLFSSAAALLPSPGMSAYVAANTFQDALARFRRGRGLPALSVAWGPWLATGMAQRVGRSRENQWRAHGLTPLAPRDALATLGRFLGREQGHVGVFSVRWPELLRAFPGPPPPYLEKIVAGVQPQTRNADDAVYLRLLEMNLDERAAFLESYLTDRLVSLLGTDRGSLSRTDNLPLAGVDSLMIMDVLNGLRDDLRFMVYPREFYEQPTIQGLALYLSAEFARSHNEPAATPAPSQRLPIPRPRFASEPEGEPLPAVAFVLSSPRSGSTLLRVMLAGHPALFSPPELHLLPFATMGERAALLGGTHLGEGLQRALMALPGEAEDAAALIDEWVRGDVPVRDVYAELQRGAGSRLLIDKSPSYAVSRDVLSRAERLFRGARYIHLVRHPYAVIESFVRLRMDKLLGADGRDPHAIAEEIWTAANRNILDTLAVIAPERYHRVVYEDLVRRPREVLTGCCEFLGIPFDEALLTPYAGGRMTEGTHAVSAPVGDPDFLTHDDIDAHLGEKWREIDLGRPLQQRTRSLAAEFGYELPHDPPPAAHRETYVETPRGLRLCLCSWGDDDAPLIVLLHGILEQGAAWSELAPLLVARGFRVVAPDLRGHGHSDHVGRGGSYHLMDFVADVDAIAASAGGAPFTLVGHSMGSAIAALFAAARPDAVSSLVLVETLLPEERPARDDADGERLATQLDYLAAASAHPVLPNLEAAASRMMAAQPGLAQPLALKLAERHTKPAPDGLQWRWDPLLATRAGLGFGDESAGRARYLSLLRNLRPPLTLIFGREARFGIPDSETVILGGGHNLHIEKPGALAAAIGQAAMKAISHEVH